MHIREATPREESFSCLAVFLAPFTYEVLILHIVILPFGVHGGACWLRHRATSQKVAGSIPDGVIGIFH
jgi:hypothetical protein